MADFRGDSREVWTSAKTVEHINAGSLQRIADATELMARRHLDLIRERDEYERRYKAAVARERALERKLSAAKGQITKLRNAAKKEQNHAPIGADALRETHNTVVQGRAALASAAQPERVPLTDLQIDECLPLGVAGYSALIGDNEIRAFARAVEATHGIKPAKEDKP